MSQVVIVQDGLPVFFMGTVGTLLDTQPKNPVEKSFFRLFLLLLKGIFNRILFLTIQVRLATVETMVDFFAIRD